MRKPVRNSANILDLLLLAGLADEERMYRWKEQEKPSWKWMELILFGGRLSG